MRVWADGVVLDDPTHPVLAAGDHGLTVGDGVFEVAKIRDGRVFALGRHLTRLARSASALGLEAPEPGRVRDAVDALLVDGGPAMGVVRITVTGGPSALGSGRPEKVRPHWSWRSTRSPPDRPPRRRRSCPGHGTSAGPWRV